MKILKSSFGSDFPVHDARRLLLVVIGVLTLFYWFSRHSPASLKHFDTTGECYQDGGHWLGCLLSQVRPSPEAEDCKAEQVRKAKCDMFDRPAIPYNRTGMPRTALASFPRSGNSYLRSLVEKASGYQTSSVYCDSRLKPAFAGECAGLRKPWLVKVRRSPSRDAALRRC